MMYKRVFSSSSVKRKALDNWKRPSIDEIGVPAESWVSVYTKNQKKFNIQLLAGAGLLGVTVFAAYNAVDTNTTPEFVNKTGFVTKLPEEEQHILQKLRKLSKLLKKLLMM